MRGKKKTGKSRENYSIKTLMLTILFIGWVIPLLLITGATGQYIISHHFDNKIASLVAQLDFHSELSVERLNNAIMQAKQISYDGDLNELYMKHITGKLTQSKFIRAGNTCLEKHYSSQEAMKFVLVWFGDDSDPYYCSTVNKSVGGTYQMVQNYWDNDYKEIMGKAGKLDTSVGFYSNSGRTYLFRNLLDSRFQRIGTMVIRLNDEYCFGHMKTMAENVFTAVQVNDMLLKLPEAGLSEEDMNVIYANQGKNHFWVRNKLFVQQIEENDNFILTATVKFEDSSVYSPLYGYRVIIFGMLLLLLPLFLVVIWIFRKRVQEPVEAMMYGSLQIEKGRLGFQLSEDMGAKEFQYLQDSFNQMSRRLKYQFDHIYEEEIALRDAKIMALQSHINPHFMNNTLEIINWEARMAGADKVSKMISALGTLMDATIDRKKRPEVLLSEEMEYVNAYFYIISERFGDRLVIRNEIPGEVMDYEVPRLILQPVIENAIEHGAARLGNGTVVLKGHVEGQYLCLDIINDAVIEDFDEEKVKRLLDPEYDTSKESSGNMGIANVNQRLRILYGEPCGLTICRYDETHIIARLTILIHKRARKDNK